MKLLKIYTDTKGISGSVVIRIAATRHVETVVLLSQQKPSDKIEVDLDLDELDVKSAETKGTYAEIRVFV